MANGIEEITLRELQESLTDIRSSRGKLGKFTLRYMMEAVYGDAYTRQILGETGGNILMEDVILHTETRDGGVHTRLDTRIVDQLPDRKLTKEERQQAVEELDRQEQVAQDAALRSSRENITAGYSNEHRPSMEDQSDAAGDVLKKLAEMSPEEREGLLKLLRGLE